jgi:hypothetical protein
MCFYGREILKDSSVTVRLASAVVNKYHLIEVLKGNWKNPLKLSDNCVPSAITISNAELCVCGSLSVNSDNQLTFVMVKCGVFFAVRTEFLNII